MGVKLRKFLLRYYPPGVILQYEKDGQTRQKPVDLLDLSPDSNAEVRANLVLAALDRFRDHERTKSLL